MYRGVELAGARMVITGGGSGIGRLLGLGAARRGAQVNLWDLNLPAAQAVAEEIAQRCAAAGSDGSARAFHVNVTDRDRVREAAAETGPVDIVVNNAGIVSGKSLMDLSEGEIERTFAVNSLAPFWVTRAFLPAMLDQNRGAVVVVASAAGLIGVAKQTDYSASKFAAVGFAEALRNELHSTGSDLGVLTVTPYYIDTGMFAGVATKFPKLLPILKEREVAGRILMAIEHGDEQLAMPPMVRALPLLRALPTRGFDQVADFFGLNRGMDHFTGRGAS